MASGLQMPQDSLFGIAIQQGTGTEEYDKMADGYENPDLVNMSYFPLLDSNFGITKQQDVLPDEIGGKALSFGSFVTGVFGGGTASLIARLENRLGWLLLATMGSVSSEAGIKADDLTLIGGAGTTTSGVNSHIFTFSEGDEFFAPWLTIHRKLPHVTSEEEVGEILQDARIGTMTLNAAAGAPVGIDLNVLGRRLQDTPEFDVNPGWTATYDDFSTFAVTNCQGHFKIGGVAFDVTNVTLTFNNNVLPPMESLVIGSIDPKDFPLLSRTVTVTATILVDNYDLYLSTFAGEDVDAYDSGTSTPNDTVSSCTVYKGDLDVELASQVAIGATTEPYKLRIMTNTSADNVAWQVQPIRTVPRRPVVLQVVGNIEALADATALYVILQNGETNYLLPT